MNESETRAEHIDPALKAAGRGVVEGSSIRREYPITLGRLATSVLSRNRASTSSATGDVPVNGDVPVIGDVLVPEPVEGYFGEYPPDFFDFIVIDECHRGGANDTLIASLWVAGKRRSDTLPDLWRRAR